MTILFIEADEPLLMFSSVEMAEQYLEAVDVRSGVYKRAFGQAGELFSIEAESEIVVIRATEQPADPDGLCELLRRSLHGVGEAFLPDADLPTLVAAVEARWTKRQRFATAISRWGCIVAVFMLVGLGVFI
ncbi:hypothetical protein [Sphingomonas solaris]|uniref:Uncharacterized protein n=1 Tax=Alterirhizorhabdus solaris TaxID=2529389 RepID=A0A558QX19_9SPHN|nr:hypothetical protein [Sphingomonas solaris]TVV71665.1 hypothetical protein FOY91_16225 [Sphingomonas solaris]